MTDAQWGAYRVCGSTVVGSGAFRAKRERESGPGKPSGGGVAGTKLEEGRPIWLWGGGGERTSGGKDPE